MIDISQNVRHLLGSWGVGQSAVTPLSSAMMFTVVCLLLVVVYYVLVRIVEPAINRITRYTQAKWDDVVFRHNVVKWIWLLIVALFAVNLLPTTLSPYPRVREIVEVMMRLALITCMMMIAIEGVKSVFVLLGEHENVADIVEEMHAASDNNEEYVYRPTHSLKGLQQMLCIIIAGVGIILMLSTILGRDPLIIFSGLGAMAAVLLLIFQDSILGVVAGVQITVNDMLRPGDWIVADKYGANGIVREITLAAVKVQNWDQSIITIPPYHLISEGFQNWRGMFAGKGRRVARAINIDMSYVRRLSDQEVEQMSQQPWWQDSVAPGTPVNLTAFRMWLVHYITTVPTMVPDMLFMVRELAPTPEGLPVEMYFFTSETSWARYERVQADVFDQVLATLNAFGLRVFQRITNR